MSVVCVYIAQYSTTSEIFQKLPVRLSIRRRRPAPIWLHVVANEATLSASPLKQLSRSMHTGDCDAITADLKFLRETAPIRCKAKSPRNGYYYLLINHSGSLFLENKISLLFSENCSLSDCPGIRLLARCQVNSGKFTVASPRFVVCMPVDVTRLAAKWLTHHH